MRSTTFNPDSWLAPIQSGHNAADIVAIRVRGSSIPTKRFELVGTVNPSAALRQEVSSYLEGHEGKIRIESLNSKSEPIGSENYTLEPPAMPPSSIAPQNSESTLNLLINRLGDTVGTLTKSNSDLVESIRKSKQDAPDFFVGLYRESIKKVEALQVQVTDLTSERDIALTMLKQSRESPEKAHALVEGLRELKGLAGTAVPTVQQLLQKMIQSLLEGKTEDLIALLKEQSLSVRVRIVVGLTLAAVQATPLEERQEFLLRSQDELKKGLGIE